MDIHMGHKVLWDKILCPDDIELLCMIILEEITVSASIIVTITAFGKVKLQLEPPENFYCDKFYKLLCDLCKVNCGVEITVERLVTKERLSVIEVGSLYSILEKGSVDHMAN